MLLDVGVAEPDPARVLDPDGMLVPVLNLIG
jgi:hypothetical protein